MRNSKNRMINIIQYCVIGTIISNIQRSYIVVDGFSIPLHHQSMRTKTTIRHNTCASIAPNNYSNNKRCQKQQSSSLTLNMIDALFSEPASSVALSKKIASAAVPVLDSKTGETIQDVNGKVFTIGSIVRVSTNGLKQYQIPSKGCGTFHEVSKEFIPDSTSADATSKKQCLVLPIGLRGIVTRIYNVDIVSANLPIQVKFVPNEYIEEGYSTPISFTMHFLPDEIECV